MSKTVRLERPITDASGGRRRSVTVRVIGPDWEPVAPAYFKDKGYQADRGNVWTAAPVGSIVFKEVFRDGAPYMDEVGIVQEDGSVRTLVGMDALPYWRAFEVRFGSRELSACPMPETVSARRLKEFETRFGMDLGRYVAIVPPERLPAPEHYDWREGRKLDHEYSWTSFSSVAHYEKDGWKIAVIHYSHQPFKSNKFTLAARVGR